jgi:hypothetical protein
MKHVLVLLTLLICTPIFIRAQETKKTVPQAQRFVNEIDVSYYNTHIGSNIAMEYNRNFGKHTLVLGIKCHLNHDVGISSTPGNYETYRKHFYARKLTDYIGATLGYEYHLKNINPYVSPYVLYNLQYARMPVKHTWVDRDYNYGYRYNVIYDGPFIALENTIGAGFSVKLTDWLSLNQSGGVNLPFIYNQYPELNNMLRGWNFDGISYQWRAGLTVRL